MKQNSLLFGAIAVLFIAIGVYFGTRQLTPEVPQDAAATHFFTLSLPDAPGKPHDMSQWKGKTLVINFWATWCAPCVQEMPELSALQREIASKNVQIIGIGIDSASNIGDFSVERKIDYPLYVAGLSGTELSRAFGNQAGGLPFTVLIGPDGQIKKRYLGRLKLDDLRRDLFAL